MDLNESVGCLRPEYIPTVSEYSEALGGYGVLFTTLGAVTTVLLYLLFFQQIWFTYANTHKAFRRHIYWLISIYPMVTLMCTLAMVVPRAHEICSAVKITYMSIGVGHFADLTILMYGSENLMLAQVNYRPLQLNVLPLCCCLPCLPKPPTSKWPLRLTVALVYQMPITQFIYYFLAVYLNIAEVSNNTVAVILTMLNFASFLSGVYALNVLENLVRQDLFPYRYSVKSMALKILILTTKLQAFLFNVLGSNGVFPCLNEFITPVVYENTLENSVLLVEMLVFGFFSYAMYSRPEFKEFLGDNEIFQNVIAKNSGPNATEMMASGQVVSDAPHASAPACKITSNDGIFVANSAIA
ncbi:organic solute transporter subunit alpha [Hyalella azteca]|uniref:Organic solute transporter subunit alpha n=1 Tax=Hyalella azteca TaxID=294128 RepID=A0A979FTL4_HYAAZ|nr:organic solute transporter subunit alpha [Hyalella azteca]